MTPVPDVNAQVSATVRSLLAYRQTSPEVVRHALGMSSATWHRRLKGERDWTAAEVAQLAALFEVPVQLLYAGPAEYAPGQRQGGRGTTSSLWAALGGVSPAARRLAVAA